MTCDTSNRIGNLVMSITLVTHVVHNICPILNSNVAKNVHAIRDGDNIENSLVTGIFVLI